MLELRDVTKTYAGHGAALRDVSLRIEQGQTLALVGPSGCGKTTALRLMNRLIEPDSGELFWDGTSLRDVDIIAHRRSCGYVIQDVGLLPHWTIAQNIATVPRLLEWDSRAIEQRVDELLHAVDLDVSLKARRPAQLSGGQRQRVGIARALAAKPKLLLMDEPFGALDPLTRAKLRQLVQRIRKKEKLTCVLVTHDLQDAMRLADRIAVLRDGQVVHVGDTAELDACPDPWVREFLGAAAG